MYELDTNGGVYEGQLNNGKRDGLGKMTWADGDVFEGQWKNEKLNGLGRMTFPSGDWVEGQFKDNIPIETQTVKTAMARYGGVSAFQIKDGKVEAIYDANGNRRMLRTANGNRMSDFFLDFSNYIATKMYELDTNGGVYEGQLNNGKRDGLGKMTWADGDVFEGQWKNEKLNGLGRMTFPSGDWVEGQFKDNIPIETQTVKTAMARYGGVSAFQIKDGKVEAIYDANGDRRMLRTANGMDPEKSHE